MKFGAKWPGAALAGGALLALSACDSAKEAPPPPEATASGQTPLADGSAPAEVPGATPVKDRVATLGLINKRNNVTQTFQLKPGESKRFGNAVVRLAVCEKTAPWENQQETGAFVQLFVEERASTKEKLAWHKVFSGWLFRNSPSLNVVEHAVYDVWVKDCAMRFPGEEASDVVTESKDAKASGSGNGGGNSAPVAPAEEPPADEPAQPD